MKRFLISVFVLALACASVVAQKIAVPCPSPLNDITDCPETGCGPSLDPHLNRLKNIPSNNRDAEVMTIQQIRNLPDPVKGFKVGQTREKIKALGEGKKIIVVANALTVRKGGAESCNCKLTAVADTDNHIVLVDRVLRIKPGETAKQTLARREENSITAEFAARARLEGPILPEPTYYLWLRSMECKKCESPGYCSSILNTLLDITSKDTTTGRFIPCWRWSIVQEVRGATQKVTTTGRG